MYRELMYTLLNKQYFIVIATKKNYRREKDIMTICNGGITMEGIRNQE